METGTFPQVEVKDIINKHFVPLKYESGKASEQFFRFGVTVIPTYIFLDSKGNEINRIIGFYSTGDFIKQLQDVSASTSI